MTFLAPIPAIAAACVCIPALIAMYLLKLRRRELLVSSTRFWVASQKDTQGNVPFRWLRPNLVFLLQLLALTMLLLALARPVLHSAGTRRERTIIVVDSSASMGARDMPDGRSRFEHAMDRAREIAKTIAQSAGRGDVLVIDLAHEPRLMVPTTTGTRALLDAIDTIEQTDQPAGMDALVDMLGGIVRTRAPDEDEPTPNNETNDETGEKTTNSDNSAPMAAVLPTHIILLTDGGDLIDEIPTAAFSGAITHARLSLRKLVQLPHVRLSYECTVIDVMGLGRASKALFNAGITSISARRDAHDGALTRVLVRLGIASLTPASMSPPVVGMEIMLEGDVIDTRVVTLRTAEQQTFEVRAPAGGVLTVRLLTDDALEADNEASIVLAPSRKPSILFVVPDGEIAEDRSLVGPAWLVGDVLAELPSRRYEVIGQHAWEQFERSGAAPNADIIVFDRVVPQRVPDVPTISFGADIFVDSSAEPVEPTPGAILVWERAHPLVRDIALDTVSGMVAPMQTENPSVRTTVLARGVRGPIIALHETEGVRHCVVGIQLATSAWPMDFGFAVFLATAVESLTGTDPSRAGASFATVDPPSTHSRSANLARDAAGSTETMEFQRWFNGTMRQHAAHRITRTDTTGPSERTARFSPFVRAGVYQPGSAGARVSAGAGSGTERWQPIAVNLVSDIETAMRSPTELDFGSGGSLQSARAQLERELWQWFLVAALVLMTLEWFASLQYRRRV